MRQIAILPSGCQPNALGTILHFNEERIYYASTLAVYVVNARTFIMEKIISLNHKSITSISISPHDNNLMVVSGTDGAVCLWHVENEEILSKIQLPAGSSLLWNLHSRTNVAIVSNEATSLKLYNWYCYHPCDAVYS